MAFTDWVSETAYRFRTDRPTTAARRSAMAFVRGGFRRAGRYLGRSIWERPYWDVLVILDACRYDLWDDVAPEYGLPVGETVWSNASCSIDWIERNFSQHPDEISSVGYVTANPFADHDAEHARSADLADTDIGHFRPLYKSEWGPIDTDPPIETVPPERVTDHAIDAWRRREEFGFDRLVVHYMQPHEPFIAAPEWSYATPHDNPVLKNLVSDGYEAGTSPWRMMIDSGEVTPEEFWPVYQDNLRWVLEDVDDRLLKNLDGRVVISADHGNGLGEWGEWHHPPGAIGPAVRRVPWIAVQTTDHRTVTPQIEYQGEASSSANETHEQLEALGYR